MKPATRYLDVSLQDLDLSRGGRRVLEGINWRVAPGERWVLVGANGAGKTQLLKLLAGEVWPDPPRPGRPAPRRTWRLGRECFTTPAPVRESIAYLGPERQDRWERYDQDYTALAVVGTGLHRTDIPLDPLTAKDRERALSLLRSFGIARLAGRRLLTLSFGERRLVLLARALATRPALLLLDEAASGLDDSHRRRLLRWLDRSKASDLPWVYSTHHAEELPASANRLLVLERGHIVYAGAPVGRALARRRAATVTRARASPREPAGPAAARRTGGKPLVRLENADVHADGGKRLLAGIDFEVRAGECWVVHGANGAGKTTFVRTLYGDLPVALPGRLLRFGRARVPVGEFRRRCALIAPHLHAAHLSRERIIDVVVSGLHGSIGLNEPATTAERRRALRALREMGIGECAERTVREVSYGQMRRALFARALIGRPSLLLLDEPFAGIDVATRAALMAVIDARVRKGLAVVMSTHHRAEWPRSATHELELARGRIVHRGAVRRRAR